uniref:Uncharacterized protein n=1 Tax=Davidia involucrata TaxID=16924 RepID=A0A5B7BRD1_DAVIN
MVDDFINIGGSYVNIFLIRLIKLKGKAQGNSWLYFLFILFFKTIPGIKGANPVDKALTTMGSGEGQMYAVLLLQAERLFLQFEPVTFKSQWNNLTVVSRPMLSKTTPVFSLYIRALLLIGVSFF